MTGTFTARIDELRHTLGGGQRLTGSVTVDQRYAAYQHEHLELHHPRGGSGKYLQKPLFDHYRDYLADYAKTVLSDGGQPAMRRSMEHLSDQVEITAPREWGDLRKSGRPQVKLGDRTVYDRAPKAARLTGQELKAKSRAILRERLAAGFTVYFMRGGKVIRIPGKNEPHAPRGRELWATRPSPAHAARLPTRGRPRSHRTPHGRSRQPRRGPRRRAVRPPRAIRRPTALR